MSPRLAVCHEYRRSIRRYGASGEGVTPSALFGHQPFEFDLGPLELDRSLPGQDPPFAPNPPFHRRLF